MKLEFPQDDADLAQSLSAVVRVGDDLWVGSDEGTKAMCLRRDKGDRSKPPFRRVDEVDLLIVGLRGPVLFGMAMLLELKVTKNLPAPMASAGCGSSGSGNMVSLSGGISSIWMGSLFAIFVFAATICWCSLGRRCRLTGR